jgi:hypothetical protein
MNEYVLQANCYIPRAAFLESVGMPPAYRGDGKMLCSPGTVVDLDILRSAPDQGGIGEAAVARLLSPLAGKRSAIPIAEARERTGGGLVIVPPKAPVVFKAPRFENETPSTEVLKGKRESDLDRLAEETKRVAATDTALTESEAEIEELKQGEGSVPEPVRRRRKGK